ncbi:MAG TPA: hypothetical protein VKC61_13535 [Pyrinomonadaceae bacterium]|nr:hypothetical protein [Pyrinomonadaceae bacterium]
MPQSTQIAAFMLGAVLLLIALLGGRFKTVFGEINDKVEMPVRLVAFALSLLFLGLGLKGSIEKTATQSLVSEPSTASSPSTAPTQAGTPAGSSSPGKKNHTVDIGGDWKDETDSIMHITQNGDTFKFTVSNDVKGSSGYGSSATGYGTIGTNSADVVFTLTRMVAGEPVVAQYSGMLSLDSRVGMQGNFSNKDWGKLNHYYHKQSAPQP